MTLLQIVGTAVLVGTSPDRACVYSALIPLEQYWDGEHPWDDSAQVKALKLSRLQGLLFGQAGELLQEFESNFSLESGTCTSGWAKHADGTHQTW